MNTKFNVTESAMKRLSFLASKQEKPGACLRLVVEGGGCSGFQYRFDFPVWDQASDDIAASIAGSESRVLVDSLSYDFLKNATLDYKETLSYSGFEIINPETKAKCGCGNSFSL